MIEVIATAACLNILVPIETPNKYRWINIVTNDPQGAPPTAFTEEPPQAPYIDPPVGGWHYDPILKDDIYYWDSNNIGKHRLSRFQSKTHLLFKDCPKDTRMEFGDKLKFTTLLVDTKDNNRPIYMVKWYLNHKQKIVKYYNGRPILPPNIKELIDESN